MKINELIKELEQVKKEHGNLEVRNHEYTLPIDLKIAEISDFQSTLMEGEPGDKYLTL